MKIWIYSLAFCFLFLGIASISQAQNQVPTAISISWSAIEENQPAGTVIGEFTTTDPDDGDTHSYSLSGQESSRFILEGNILKSNEIFDFEEKSSYSITITSDDGKGGRLTRAFPITIFDIDENPVLAISRNPEVLVYPNPAMDQITVESSTKGLGLLTLTNMSGSTIKSQIFSEKSTIDVKSITRGFYILKISSDQINHVSKILVK